MAQSAGGSKTDVGCPTSVFSHPGPFSSRHCMSAKQPHHPIGCRLRSPERGSTLREALCAHVSEFILSAREKAPMLPTLLASGAAKGLPSVIAIRTVGISRGPLLATMPPRLQPTKLTGLCCSAKARDLLINRWHVGFGWPLRPWRQPWTSQPSEDRKLRIVTGERRFGSQLGRTITA